VIKPTEISLEKIADDLHNGRLWTELRSSWAIALLYRVPSLPLVWLAARIGISPTTVTLLALALAFSMPLQAVFLPLGIGAWAVALSGILFQILDCVDGTLARVTGQSSKRGADLDFLVDMAQWGLLYLAIGLLADRTLDDTWNWTAIAALAAWLRLMARLVRDRLDQPTDDDRPAQLTPAQLPGAFVAGLSGLVPFLALTGGGLGWAVSALLIYSVLDLVEGLLPLLHRPNEK